MSSTGAKQFTLLARPAGVRGVLRIRPRGTLITTEPPGASHALKVLSRSQGETVH